MTSWTLDLSPASFVLDSWPLVERALRNVEVEPLTKLVEAASRREIRLLISEINLGELFYLLAKQKGIAAAENLLNAFGRTPIQIIPVAQGDVLRAARLKARYAISYADCFCANLAIDHKAAVLTGDPDFLLLQAAGLLQVHWLGL